MKFKFVFTVSYKHGKNNHQPQAPTPPQLLDQQQELLEAQAKIEAQYEQYLKQLKEAAQRLISQTRDHLDTVLHRDISTTVDSHRALKKNERQHLDYIQRIKAIQSTLAILAQGDIHQIHELQQNEIFSQLFPHFNLQLFAAHSGMPEILKILSSSEYIAINHQKSEECAARKRKDLEEVAYANLNPQYKALLDRPFLERAAAVFSFYHNPITDSKIPKRCHSLQDIKEYWGVSQETAHPHLPDVSGQFFSPADNISRMVQLIINHYFNHRVPDPVQDRNSLILVFALASIPTVLATRIQNYYIPYLIPSDVDRAAKFSKQTDFNYLYRYIEKRSTKALIFAGMMRVLCESGHYGEDIGKMMKEVYENYYLPTYNHVDRLLELAHTPVNERIKLLKNWYAQRSPLIIEPGWLELIASYSEITRSGRYPLGDSRIWNEAQDLENQSIVKLCVETQALERPKATRIAAIIIFNLMLHYQKRNYTISYEEIYTRSVNEIDLNRDSSSIEIDRLSQIVEDILAQVSKAGDPFNSNNMPSFSLGLSMAKIALKVLLYQKDTAINDEIETKIFAAMTAGVARRFYTKEQSRDEILSLFWKLENVMIPISSHFEKMVRFSELSYAERRNKENYQKYCVPHFYLEDSDLLEAYRVANQTSQYPIGDARIVLEAMKLCKKIEKTEINSQMLANSPFMKTIPEVTEPWKLHQLPLRHPEEWNVRIVTPEVLVHEAEQGQSLLHSLRQHLAVVATSKIGTRFTEGSHAANDPKIQNKLLSPSLKTLEITKDLLNEYTSALSRPVSKNIPPSFIQSEHFRVPKEGLYILECIPKSFSYKTRLHTQSVYVRNASFIKTPLLEHYECGTQTLEFIEPLSGEFTLHQGQSIKVSRFNNVEKMDFILNKEGPFQFKIQLQDTPDIIETHRAIAYQKSRFDWNRTCFTSRKTETGMEFSFNQNTIAHLSSNGNLILSKELLSSDFSQEFHAERSSDYHEMHSSSPSEMDRLQRKYQKTLRLMRNQFQGPQELKTAKIMMVVQRLIPESLMFGPFVALAGYFEDIDHPKGLNKLVHLLCQHVALHKLMKKEGVSSVRQFINSQQDNFPKHWALIFSLIHGQSENEILQGLFLQTLTFFEAFLKVPNFGIQPSEVFKLTRQLFSFREPEQIQTLTEHLDKYLVIEPNYYLWLAQINSVLGPDKKSLKLMEKPFEDFINLCSEKFYVDQIRIGNNLGLNRAQNYTDATGIEKDCIQTIEELKENFDTLQANYQKAKQEVEEGLNEVGRAITDYQSQYKTAMRDAIKTARKKQRNCMIRNLAGMIAGAFLAPMFAPALLGAIGASASGLALAVTEGAIAGAIKEAISGGNILKGAGTGGLLAGIGLQSTKYISTLKLPPIVTGVLANSSKTLASTAVNGGKVMSNLAISCGTSLLGYGLEMPVESSNSFLLNAGTTLAKTAGTAGLTSIVNDSSFASSLISAGMGTAQDIAGQQGKRMSGYLKQQAGKYARKQIEFDSKQAAPTPPTLSTIPKSQTTRATPKSTSTNNVSKQNPPTKSSATKNSPAKSGAAKSSAKQNNPRIERKLAAEQIRNAMEISLTKAVEQELTERRLKLSNEKIKSVVRQHSAKRFSHRDIEQQINTGNSESLHKFCLNQVKNLFSSVLNSVIPAAQASQAEQVDQSGQSAKNTNGYRVKVHQYKDVSNLARTDKFINGIYHDGYFSDSQENSPGMFSDSSSLFLSKKPQELEPVLFSDEMESRINEQFMLAQSNIKSLIFSTTTSKKQALLYNPDASYEQFVGQHYHSIRPSQSSRALQKHVTPDSAPDSAPSDVFTLRTSSISLDDITLSLGKSRTDQLLLSQFSQDDFDPTKNPLIFSKRSNAKTSRSNETATEKWAHYMRTTERVDDAFDNQDMPTSLGLHAAAIVKTATLPLEACNLLFNISSDAERLVDEPAHLAHRERQLAIFNSDRLGTVKQLGQQTIIGLSERLKDIETDYSAGNKFLAGYGMGELVVDGLGVAAGVTAIPRIGVTTISLGCKAGSLGYKAGSTVFKSSGAAAKDFFSIRKIQSPFTIQFSSYAHNGLPYIKHLGFRTPFLIGENRQSISWKVERLASQSNFASICKLEQHYLDHVVNKREFKGAYGNIDQYLAGARDVIRYGDKVQYNYVNKGTGIEEVRYGYVKFMGNSKKGSAKFEFVGTNLNGEITTYHVKGNEDLWRLLNNNSKQKVILPLEKP